MSKKHNTKREHVINAAIKLWRETHNVKKVSLADIAREANVSPTTVYNNFGTREKLIDEVIDYVMHEIINKQWEVVRGNLPVPLKIQSIIRIKTSTMQVMYSDVLTKLAEDSSVRQHLNEIYEVETKPMMNEIIEEGKSQGYIRPDLPNEAVMIYLDMLKDGLMANTEQFQHFMSDSQLMNGLSHIVYNGLFQKKFDFAIDFAEEKETV